MVRRAQKVIEQTTGCSLSPQQRSAHQTLLESVWRANDRDAIDYHLAIIRNYVALADERLTGEQIAALGAKLRSASSAGGSDFARWLSSIHLETQPLPAMTFARTSGQ
jgi:hypothetical protein